MASLLKRIFGLGKQGVEKTLDKYEDKIYLLQDELKKYKESRIKINDSLVELKGKQLKNKKDEEDLIKLIADLDKGAKKANSEGKIDLAKEAFHFRTINSEKLKTLKLNISSTEEAIQKIENQIKIIDSKIQKMDAKIQELKIKDNFTKNVNEINNTIRDINGIIGGLGDRNDLVDKIETDFYVAEAKIEDLDDGDSVERLLNESDTDFNEYIKSLGE